MNFNTIIKYYIIKKWFLILIFVISSSIALPLESIGFSNYATYIVNEYSKENSSLKMIYYYIIIIIIIIIITKIFSTLELHIEYIIDRDLMELIRKNIFNSIIEKYKYKYSEIELGKVISQISILPNHYQELIYRGLKELIPKMISIFILNIYFYFINIKLGFTITIFLIINFCIILYNKKKSQILTINKIKDEHLLNEKVSDKMSNIFSILVNGNINNELKENAVREEKHKKIVKDSNIHNTKVELYLNMTNTLFFISIILIYYSEIKNNTKKNYTMIASLFIFIYIYAFLNNSTWYINNYFNIIGTLTYYDGEFNVKNKKISYNKNNKNIKLQSGCIEFKNVNYSYDTKRIINNLNFKIIDKKINCIIGTSGSGKTTIIKLILGLLPLTEGSIKIDNKDIYTFPQFYLNSNISMVSQNIKLFNGTILENIKYGNANNNITNNKIDSFIKELNLHNTVFKKLPNGLQTQVGVNGSHLSNGQQQITLILRAFLQDKKIIILDEPTTALDTTTKQIILDLIKKLSHNKTIIIVTHDIDVKNISHNFINLNEINKIPFN